MRDAVADRLRKRLIERGVARAGVERLLAELGDHFDDLVAASIEAGTEADRAEAEAERQLGAAEDIERAALAQPALRSWAWRWPRLALIVYPAAWAVTLPAVPILAGIRHADSILRWLICVGGGALVTAAILLVLQLSITLA